MLAAPLRLTIATPTQVVVDHVEAVSLRAEDASGSFGIHVGHADFVTLLTASVVQWQTAGGTDANARANSNAKTRHFCAVDGGVLVVSGGDTIDIACREAIPGDSVESLEAQVRRTRAAQLDAERRARVDQLRLHALAVRHLLRLLAAVDGTDGLAALAQQGTQQEPPQ